MTDSMTQLEYFMVAVEECPDCGAPLTRADLSTKHVCEAGDEED